ncbi:hypothetical protein C5167_047846 [Papaver somniferum]|uniref:Uncharacterized protein n=1 Tax=Papaver somniferum TaxID=3469 RepID=A0A4Y7LLT4_PAPSO|nr:hypothetical protein C5167_047846 [Papaver somniferum]
MPHNRPPRFENAPDVRQEIKMPHSPHKPEIERQTRSAITHERLRDRNKKRCSCSIRRIRCKARCSWTGEEQREIERQGDDELQEDDERLRDRKTI